MKRVLIWSALLAGGILGGNWGVSAYTARQTMSEFLENHPKFEGRMGQIGGFPHALNFRLSNLRWHEPSDNLRWDLGAADVHIPLFHRGQIQLSFSERQIVEMADTGFVLDSDEIRADLELGPDNQIRGGRLDARALRFDRVAAVQSVAALTADLTNLDGALYRVVGTAEDIRLASDLFPQGESVVAKPLSMSFDTNLIFTSSMSVDGVPPQLYGIEIAAVELKWPPAALMLDGTLVRNSRGLFDGRLHLTTNHWEDLQDGLIRSGVFSPDLAPMVFALLGSQSDPDTGRLSVQLTVSDSAVRFGPFVIATLPRW